VFKGGDAVADADAADQIRHMLAGVLAEGGTGRRAGLDGYSSAGKTGTVHKVGPGGYMDDQYVALFAGIAPSNDPRIVTVVVINEPKGDAYGGGSAAAPVFSQVTKGALRILNVPPTETGVVAKAPPVARGGAA